MSRKTKIPNVGKNVVMDNGSCEDNCDHDGDPNGNGDDDGSGHDDYDTRTAYPMMSWETYVLSVVVNVFYLNIHTCAI